MKLYKLIILSSVILLSTHANAQNTLDSIREILQKVTPSRGHTPAPAQVSATYIFEYKRSQAGKLLPERMLRDNIEGKFNPDSVSLFANTLPKNDSSRPSRYPPTLDNQNPKQ